MTSKPGIGLAVLVAVTALPVLHAEVAPGQLAEGDGYRLDGAASLRLMYDDNIYLADDENEIALRRRLGDGTKGDVILRPGLELDLTLEPNEQHKFNLAYDIFSEVFFDEDDENMLRQRLRAKHRWRFTEQASWTTGVDFVYEDRRRDNVYLRPDFWELSPYGGLTLYPTERDRFWLGYRYEYRDYDSLSGTPFRDYFGHVFDAAWRHRWTQALRTDLSVAYRPRRYDKTALDAAGAPVPSGRKRHDDLYEAQLASTLLLGSRTALRPAYRFRDNQSSGAFYDYREHRGSLLLLHMFDTQPEMVGSAYLHYRHRDYDHQVARRVVDAKTLNVLPRDSERVDRQWFLRLKLEQRWTRHWSTDVSYTHIRNQSKDDSSEYDDNRFEIGVRYKF